MDKQSPRPPAGVFLSLLTSIGLVVLFFMPWLRVSCNPQGAAEAAELGGTQNVPEEFTKPTVLAHASGWDLARGKLTPEERFEAQARAAEQNQKGPPAKPWVYGALGLPVLVVLLALLCVSGKLTSSGAGKGMILFGIAGVVLMFVAASTDYIDDAMEQAEDEMAAQGAPLESPAFQRNKSEAADKAKKIIQTKTTPYLWGSLGLYVLIAGCGMAATGPPLGVRSSASFDWQDEPEEADLAAVSTIAENGGRVPSNAPSFGPPLTPTETPAETPEETPAAVGADQADSQT